MTGVRLNRPPRQAWIIILILWAGAFVATAEQPALPLAGPIRVGVFNGQGAVPGCVGDAMEALRLDGGISAREISAAEIVAGGLDTLDVILFPGGSGSRQYGDLGQLGAARVRAFVQTGGKGAVGICAGAYLLSDTPDYACLRLSPLQAIDREHDARGHGLIACRLEEAGRAWLPELAQADPFFVYYYEGPLLVPAAGRLEPVEVLARMETDVHLENDAPAGLMPGKPLLARHRAGQGRVFLCVGHPETTPGLRWLVPQMVRWSAGQVSASYPPGAVRPAIHRQALLFDAPQRKEEQELGQALLYGDAAAKTAAIRRLVELRCWPARLWIPGMLRDGAPEVRRAAARAVVELEATAALDDLQGVISQERDETVRKDLMDCFLSLSSILPVLR